MDVRMDTIETIKEINRLLLLVGDKMAHLMALPTISHRTDRSLRSSLNEVYHLKGKLGKIMDKVADGKKA